MDIKKLRKIFFSTLYLSSFTFGGGYVIVTLLKKKFVDELHWIDEKEMLDLVAIAQSSPGAIAVNGSIVVGYKICGIPGIICAVLGAIIPPFIILSAISACYTAFKNNTVIKALLLGMRSGVSAVIISVVYDMTKDVLKEKDISKIIILIASFIANYYFDINVVIIILIVIAYGLCKAFIKSRKNIKEASK